MMNFAFQMMNFIVKLHDFNTIAQGVSCCALLSYTFVKLHEQQLRQRVDRSTGALQYTKIGPGGAMPRGHVAMTAAIQPIFFAFICGSAGGYTNLFLKGVAEIVKNLLNGAFSGQPLPISANFCQFLPISANFCQFRLSFIASF